MDILKELNDRGLLYQISHPDLLAERLKEGKSIILYVGFDPTADSLHIGSLLPILVLRRFQIAGHKPIALVGGGTGMIGDPSGKAGERKLNQLETVLEWSDKLKTQLEHFLDFETTDNPAIMANNYEWLNRLSLIDFLRDIGKHFNIAYMIAKDSVKSRLETGISFTEFTYMLLQSYDFLNLFKKYNCELQVGGSDQWGNITAGVELIRKIENRQAYGVTHPLVEKADGTKFGKTEEGTIWLDANRTSPYRFYQFWINSDDRDVIKYLKYFTFLTIDEINEIEAEFKENPGKRLAQQQLASEVTRLVHGDAAFQSVQKISEALFYGNIKELSARELSDAFEGIPSFEISGTMDRNIVNILSEFKICPSKRQAREDVKNGAVYINGERNQSLDRVLEKSDLLHGKHIVIRKGKKKYFLISWK